MSTHKSSFSDITKIESFTSTKLQHCTSKAEGNRHTATTKTFERRMRRIKDDFLENFNNSETSNKMSTRNSSASIDQSRRALLAPIARTPRRRRGCFNSHIISLALISYVISNQMAGIILGSSTPIVRKSDNLIGQDYDISENMIDTQTHTYKLSSFERSLVQLVAASPAPAPQPHASRSATSVTHRVPPVNGSMFGKRSLSASRRPTSQKTTRPQAASTTNEVNAKHDQEEELSSEPTSYSDIVTELIENFMSSNNEGNPEEATVAFCRMIVYECHQVLNQHKRPGKSARAKQ